jgi:hypothetical protein
MDAVSNLDSEPGERMDVATRNDDVSPGWMPVGVVFDGQAIDLGGVDPWANGTKDWRPLGLRIVVSHPAYPHQRHRADTYEISTPVGRVVTFAATELSNGVWGFFVPVGP